MWARTFDTHDTVVVASVGDVFSDFWTELWGVLVWKPLASLPEQVDNHGHGRHLDYRDVLQGRAVLDTTRRAFDAMAALLDSRAEA
jgi:hypothetical protein